MKPETLSKARLVTMLYLLMRDVAPTGEIVMIIGNLAALQDQDPDRQVVYTSPELEQYAWRLANELLA